MENLKKDKILILDNNENDIKLYKLVFRDAFQLIFVNNAKEAKDALMQNDIKVIIVDNFSNNEDVVSFLELSAIKYPLTQRIIVTSDIEELIQDAVNKGQIFSYFIKPYVPHRLIISVEKAIEKHRLQKSNIELLESLKIKNENLSSILNKLKKEEEKFRHFFNASPDPIFIVNNMGMIIDRNQMAHKYFVDVLDSKFIEDFLPEHEKGSLTEYINNGWNNKSSLLQVAMLTNDNKVADYELNALMVEYDERKALMITCRDVSERKKTEKRILQSIIQTEEKERRRFAQELHDGIGPLLSTTKLYLQWHSKPDSKIDKSMVISKAEETLEETIFSLREISNNISPNTLNNFGLNVALQKFIERIMSASSINVEYRHDVQNRFAEEIEVSIYRIICECINNSIKHAKALNITIRIKEEDRHIRVMYKDDGMGFDVNKAIEKSNSSGLTNMRSRVESLGGTFNINSEEDNGMTIIITFNI